MVQACGTAGVLARAPVRPPSWSLGAHAASLLGGAMLLAAAAPTAVALGPVDIALTNLTAKEVQCPAGQRAMTIGMPGCLEVSAVAENTKKETFYNVDVFGRVYDANGSNVLDRDDASDAGRLANIKEVPPGKSNVSFDLIVSKLALKDGGDARLNFVKFKAKAYPGSGFKGLSPLLDDSEDCDGFLSCEGEEEQVPF